MVRKSMQRGVGYPLHVQRLLHNQAGARIDCEVERCRHEMRISARSGMQGRECTHLLLVNNALYPELIHLNNDALYELTEGGKF